MERRPLLLLDPHGCPVPRMYVRGVSVRCDGLYGTGESAQ